MHFYFYQAINNADCERVQGASIRFGIAGNGSYRMRHASF